MKIYAVIVVFQPDTSHLKQLGATLMEECAGVIMVDNTEQSYLTVRECPVGSRVITLGFNSGVAYAQNLGIETALDEGADVVVLFDQDSTIGPGFLTSLLAPLNLGKPDIVVPLHRDDTSGEVLPAVRLGRYALPKAAFPSDIAEPYQVDVVIASGTAATREVFEVAGYFDAGLFIDFVDTEWSLRCRSMGIPIRVVPTAVMDHRIGSRFINLRFFTVLVHTADRCYYQFRNCFHLLRKPYVPFLFALRESLALLNSRLLLLLFIERRVDYLRAYWAGLRDGVKGIKGARPS